MANIARRTFKILASVFAIATYVSFFSVAGVSAAAIAGANTLLGLSMLAVIAVVLGLFFVLTIFTIWEL